MTQIVGNLSTTNLEPNINDSNEQIISGVNNGRNSIDSDIENAVNASGAINNNGNITANFLRGTPNLNPNFSGLPVSGYGYVYFCFSAVEPTSNEDITFTPTEDTRYLGVLSTNQVEQPRDYSLYKWVKIRGEDGEQGETGEKGDKGDSGETSLTVINPLYFTGFLQASNWKIDNGSRGAGFYYQEINVTDTQLLTSTMTEEELINYMNIKMTDKATPFVDLLVSEEDVDLGMSQVEQWQYITRVYMIKDEYEEDEEEKVDYYLRFECYRQAPTIQLPFQVKVL